LATILEGGRVQIYISEIEPAVRQRFSLLHEPKHAIDFDDYDILTSHFGSDNPERQKIQVELLCNEFAAHARYHRHS